jgi:hypothetical protein
MVDRWGVGVVGVRERRGEIGRMREVDKNLESKLDWTGISRCDDLDMKG